MSYLRMLQEDQVPAAARSSAALSKPTDAAIAEAMHILNLTGTRIMREGAINRIGVWEDLDGPEIRAALQTVAMENLAVVKLGPDVPMRYRMRISLDRSRGESFAHWRTRAEGVAQQ